MPTLLPQRLSGLVVIPTVEQGGGVHRVSIAIDLGLSRTGTGAPQPDVVTREDLIVELRNASEGSLEPIASPDPGPLPARALRVVQARGEFTFAQSVNPPDDVVVTVRGDRKTFPMAQAFAPAGGGFSQVPQEGGPFPRPRRPGGVVPPRFPPFPLPLQPRCCGRRFEAPFDVSPDAAAKSELFHVVADFAQRPLLLRCRCTCCEYRQFVRGTFQDAAGAAVRFDMPAGPLSSGEYREDGAIDEFGPGEHGYYGHRSTSSPGDSYGGTDGATGCTYRGNETASCASTDSAHLEYVGLIVDVCRGRVAAMRTWTVDL